YILLNWDLGSAGGTGTSDVFYSVVFDASNGSPLFAERRVNGVSPGARDTALYNSNVMNLSVYAADLGLSGKFDWQGVTFNREPGPGGEGTAPDAHALRGPAASPGRGRESKRGALTGPPFSFTDSPRRPSRPRRACPRRS